MTPVTYVSARNAVSGFYQRHIASKASDQDDARKELILNMLLLPIIGLLSVCVAAYALVWTMAPPADPQRYANNAVPLSLLLLLLGTFVILFLLSRKGYGRLVAYFLLAVLYFLAAYTGYRWGVDVPVELLFFSLIIVMSGVLIGSRFAFLATAAIGTTIVVVGRMHEMGAAAVNRYWTGQIWGTKDAVFATLIFLIMAIVSWLSNREIEKSLARARRSEALLRKERDSLEIKVEQRTKELQEAQAERIVQLSRFAEFGRISAGLFHDLINPLNAVVLNMEQVRALEGNEEAVSETRQCLNSAILATRKMEDMVTAVRSQIAMNKKEAQFSLNGEIWQATDVLLHKARKSGVSLYYPQVSTILTYGDATKFGQVALNLIANAIESYAAVPRTEKDVRINLRREGEEAVLVVQDHGAGIAPEDLGRIFEPYFTTKAENGLGIGLATVKWIIEKDFGGTIVVESEEGKGTVFTIRFRIKNHEQK